MIEFGKTLTAAREAKGLTIADIAEKTHMMSSMVADLEKEDFSHLAAPIYGRGFVKLYCETVGIDPAPMIAEFMEIFNGNRTPVIRERPMAHANEITSTVPEETPKVPEPEGPTPDDVQEPILTPEAPPPMPEPIAAAEPPVKQQLDLFDSPREPQREITSNPTRLPSREPPAQPSPADNHILSRYATPLHDRVEKMRGYYPAAGRLGLVIAVLGLVIYFLVLGLQFLYRATDNRPAPEVSETPKNENKANNVRTSRTPIDVPPLYID